MSQPTQLRPEVMEFCLSTAVRMALQPGREETDLTGIARKLGELGEVRLMTDLYAHVERLQTCLRLGESPRKSAS